MNIFRNLTRKSANNNNSSPLANAPRGNQNAKMPTARQLQAAKRKLKSPRKEDDQQYIVSPHDNATQLYANSVGFGNNALANNQQPVRPVFKNEAQRFLFHHEATRGYDTAKANARRTGKDEVTKRDLDARKQMLDWSKPRNAKMNFDNTVNRQGQYPVVYTSGHGSAGGMNVIDDSKRESASGKQVATMLTNMNLPKQAEVRVHSCFSGTSENIREKHAPDAIHQAIRSNTADVTMAGDWDKTFAGSIDHHLHENNFTRKHKVVGYIGATSQNARSDVSQVTKFGTTQNNQTDMYASPGRVPPSGPNQKPGQLDIRYKLNQMARNSPRSTMSKREDMNSRRQP